MVPGAATLSDRPARNHADSPWLTVQMDHRFQHGPSGFSLHIDFETRANRVVIFGPSGSGKSSLLRAIAGLLEPDAGKIQIHGKTVWQTSLKDHATNIPTEQRHVGLVMQNPAVFPHMNVSRNVAFALRGMEIATQNEKVLRLLLAVEAESLADRWPRELSGGQLQRVAIARTLAADPSVLLLDEPFAALDAESRQQLSENLHTWATEHAVLVLTVTHNLEEAFAAGDEVLAMKEGRIVAQGTPCEVLATERSRLLLAMGASAVGYGPET